MNSEMVAERFVTAINRHDVAAILELMTEEHRFVDSLGAELRGRADMKKAWEGYFKMVPDYAITITEIFASGTTVVLIGEVSGTYVSLPGQIRPENHWMSPAAWRAMISGSKVAEWQVFADNEPMRKVMRRQAGM
jgi:ketosteroid isomerase-like protein